VRTHGAKLFVCSLIFVFFKSSFHTVLTTNCVSYIGACHPKMFGDPCRKNSSSVECVVKKHRIFLYSLINVPEMHCKYEHSWT
jgi:hypothetical protein